MTPAFETYLAAARPRAALWRMTLGLVLIIGCWVASTVLLMAGFVVVQLAAGAAVEQALEALGAFLRSPGPAPVLFQLATFVGIWPGVWLALRLLHRQSLWTLIAPGKRMRWNDFFLGFALAVFFWVPSMAAGLLLVGWPERSDIGLSTWALMLPALAAVVFVQAGGEELVFRGYMLQQLAVRLRSPLIWALLPALLFGLAHYGNGQAVGAGWHYALATLIFGATAAALVWRSGSLAAAMGLHIGMNVLALGGVGVRGVIEGSQLFLYASDAARTLFLVDEMAMLALLALVLSPWCPVRPPETAPGTGSPGHTPAE